MAITGTGAAGLVARKSLEVLSTAAYLSISASLLVARCALGFVTSLTIQRQLDGPLLLKKPQHTKNDDLQDVGRMKFELFADVVPKTAENFQ